MVRCFMVRSDCFDGLLKSNSNLGSGRLSSGPDKGENRGVVCGAHECLGCCSATDGSSVEMRTVGSCPGPKSASQSEEPTKWVGLSISTKTIWGRASELPQITAVTYPSSTFIVSQSFMAELTKTGSIGEAANIKGKAVPLCPHPWPSLYSYSLETGEAELIQRNRPTLHLEILGKH